MPNEIGPLFAGEALLRPSTDPVNPAAWSLGHALAHRTDGAGNVGGNSIRLCILGEPASKGNSRQIVKMGNRMRSIKSDKAIAYERGAFPQVAAQCHRAGWKCRAIGPVRVTMTIYYASERPDLDESVVLDVMQMTVYGNDRQVREKHVFHAIDKANPRTEILVETLT